MTDGTVGNFNSKTNIDGGVAEKHFCSLTEGSVPSLPLAPSLFLTMENGYIKIWRKIIDSSFFMDSYALHLAIYCLLKANHKETRVIFDNKEILLKRGQFITGRYSLSSATGINPSTVRNKLALLKNIGFLDSTSTNKFSIITITKYEDYQNKKNKRTAERTTKGQPEDTDNNDKNDKNKKENPLSPLIDLYKSLKGYINVPDWNKNHYPRHVKAAKELLRIAPQDWKQAMEWVSKQGYCDWTIETVIKKYPDVKKSTVVKSELL